MTRPTLSPTPGTAARNFASNNPQFTGVLLVQSVSPAGKGGWKMTAKETRFYLRAGESAQTTSRYSPHAATESMWRQNKFNGLCAVCGEIQLHPNIGYCKDDRNVGLKACDLCRERLGLRPLADGEYLSGEKSALAVHDIYRVDLILDIRNLQMQVADAPGIAAMPLYW